MRAYGSARVIVTTADGTFSGRFDTATLTDASILVLLLEDAGTAGEPLAIDIESILGVSPAES